MLLLRVLHAHTNLDMKMRANWLHPPPPFTDTTKEIINIKRRRKRHFPSLLHQFMPIIWVCVMLTLVMLIYFVSILNQFPPKHIHHARSVDITKNPPAHTMKHRYVLYRILGNDLPPRHSPGQTLVNLKFLLENEVEFEGCLKIWILNRLVDKVKEDAIIRLLQMYRQRYEIIQFDEIFYMNTRFRYSDFPQHDYFYSEDVISASQGLRVAATNHMYHSKNLYAMNNNGARNFALLQGRQLAEWIFPFDGNCFLTQTSWDLIVGQLNEFGGPYQYFVVPMV